jgi:hypothetical protein
MRLGAGQPPDNQSPGSIAMTEEKSTFLQLQLHGDAEQGMALEFLATDIDIDGVWVHTTPVVEGLGAGFRWFLSLQTIEEIAPISAELAYGNLPAFAIHDTDCSFELKFTPNSASSGFAVTVEEQFFPAQHGPAIVLRIDHASASVDEVRRFLQRLAEFDWRTYP